MLIVFLEAGDIAGSAMLRKKDYKGLSAKTRQYLINRPIERHGESLHLFYTKSLHKEVESCRRQYQRKKKKMDEDIIVKSN